MRNTGIQLRLGDFVYAILKRWKLILALTFVGLVFGIMMSAVSYMQGSYSSYEITGSFAIAARSEDGLYPSTGSDYPSSSDFHFAEDMVDAVRYVVTSDLTMNEAIDSLQMIGITPKEITQNLVLSQYNATQILNVTLTWRDAEEGAKILNAVFKAADAALKESLDIGSLVVINEPASRYTLGGSLSGNIWGVMVVLGFLAGVGYAALELLMRPTLTNLKDVETVLGLETIGVIPKDDKHFKNKTSLLVEDENESSSVKQSFSAAAYILRNRLGNSDGPKTFYVTATITGEGKTTAAANLAIALSDMEKHVLLIDLDLRNPGIGNLFLRQVDYHRSLNALYRGDATEEEAVTTLTGYLDLLPTVLERHSIAMDGTIVELIKKISQKYDYVVIDAPPVGQESDTLSLNQLADSVLFVLRYDGATLPDIRSALDRIDKTGMRVIGCIVNAAQNVSGVAKSMGFSTTFEERRRQAKVEKLFWEKDPEKDDPLEGMTAGSRKKKKDKGKKRSGKKTEASPEEIGQDASSEVVSAETAEESETPAEAASPRPKNLMEELFGEEKSESAGMDDNEAAEALFRLGIEGGWDEEPVSEPSADSPAEEEVIPEAEEVVPEIEEIVPGIEEVVPEIEEVVPAAEETVPEIEEVVPETEETIPEAEEVVPKIEEVVPEAEEPVPEAEEIFPETDILDAKEEETPPQTETEDKGPGDPASVPQKKKNKDKKKKKKKKWFFGKE